MPKPPDSRLIHRISPRNFLSFGPDFPGLDLLPLNLLIGPNGSGKSNLIEAVDFMRAAPKGFAEVTRAGGGVAEWIHKGDPHERGAVGWTLCFPSRINPLQHSVGFGVTGQRFDLFDEQVVELEGDGQKTWHYSYDGGEPMATYLDRGQEHRSVEAAQIRDPDRSVVGQLLDPQRLPELTWLADTYGKVRIYREWGFGRRALLRTPQPADTRNDVLLEDCSNTGIFLSKLKKSPAAKQAVVEKLRLLYEGLTDFEVVPEGGTVQVFLHEGNFSIPATRLSDGTLRYLCLLAILCDPEPPPLICIEEPELGLHPDILPSVADLLKSASERTQLIVTTHSDILVDAMTETPECVVVCEKHDGKTEMNRLSAEELKVWMENYRLGQLWMDGQLGGKRW